MVNVDWGDKAYMGYSGFQTYSIELFTFEMNVCVILLNKIVCAILLNQNMCDIEILKYGNTSLIPN